MTDAVNQNKWFAYFRPNPAARLRLFCFPYAGGSAAIFRTWPNNLPAMIEVRPVELPGRGARLKEPPFTHFPSLVQATAEALVTVLDQPFAFFGHSMGALIGFELIRYFRKNQIKTPVHLFVSGHTAPHILSKHRPIHNLPENEFIEELRQLNGTPEAVLQNQELMQLLIPILRADFAINETYRCQNDAPLACPMTVFGGCQDRDVTQDTLEAWREHTTGAFSLHLFEGDHFFLQRNEKEILQTIVNDLRPYLGVRSI